MHTTIYFRKSLECIKTSNPCDNTLSWYHGYPLTCYDNPIKHFTPRLSLEDDARVCARHLMYALRPLSLRNYNVLALMRSVFNSWLLRHRSLYAGWVIHVKFLSITIPYADQGINVVCKFGIVMLFEYSVGIENLKVVPMTFRRKYRRELFRPVIMK